MKKKLFLWLRRCQLPVMLLLSVMPVMLTTLCVHVPDALGATGVLFAAYVAVSSLSLLVPGSRRMTAAALGSAAMLGFSFVYLPIRTYPLLLLLPAVLIALLYFSLPLAVRQYEAEIPPFVYFIGVAVHVVVQFLHHYFSAAGNVSPYDPVDSALTAVLIGYMLLFLLSMNRISLDNASLVRYRIPAGMRGVNTAMTIVFLAGALLLSMLPAVVRGITLLWRGLSSAVSHFFAFLLSLFPETADLGMGMQGGMNGMFPSGEAANETGPLARLLEKIASIVTMVIIIVGFAILLHLITKLLLRLARHLIKRMRTYMTAAAAEYEDEITDTREDSAQREIRVLRRQRHAAQEAARTPAGRIRQTYARLLRRRPQWTASSTARENLPATAAELYERARYSDHPVTAEDAERFAESTHRL